MRDLNQIAEQNLKACQAEIAAATAAGKHVVARYTGLHYASHDEFDTLDAAKKHRDDIDALGGSNHGKIFSPAQATQGAQALPA